MRGNDMSCVKRLYPVIILLAGFALQHEMAAQSFANPYQIDTYEFIRYDLNRIQFFGDSSSFNPVYEKLDRLLKTGEGQIKILHIGGSHLQADVYTDRVRKRLQSFEPGLNGGRGFVFPYRLARTNNPTNYRVSSYGKWTGCRNVEERRNCKLGVSGISVSTQDPHGSITFWFPPSDIVDYECNRIILFYEEDSLSYDFYIDAAARISEVSEERHPGIRVFQLDRFVDSVTVRLQQTDSLQNHFDFYGISLGTDDPGFVYHSIGINGAKVPSFLRCQLLEEHVGALDPDLIILSMGTNDAYGRYFNPEQFSREYDSMINRFRSAAPGAAVILTVPNDSYLYRRYINNNTKLVQDVIYALAEENGYGVWNFYEIMGGLNSIIIWQQYGLAKRDRIHFTHKGYLLKGDLFFNALLRSYDNHIDGSRSGAADRY